MLNIKDIVKSWAISLNPNEKQIELAEKRFAICNICEHKKKYVIGYVCELCNCLLNKKIFSTQINSCPLKKWYIS